MKIKRLLAGILAIAMIISCIPNYVENAEAIPELPVPRIEIGSTFPIQGNEIDYSEPYAKYIDNNGDHLFYDPSKTYYEDSSYSVPIDGIPKFVYGSTYYIRLETEDDAGILPSNFTSCPVVSADSWVTPKAGYDYDGQYLYYELVAPRFYNVEMTIPRLEAEDNIEIDACNDENDYYAEFEFSKKQDKEYISKIPYTTFKWYSDSEFLNEITSDFTIEAGTEYYADITIPLSDVRDNEYSDADKCGDDITSFDDVIEKYMLYDLSIRVEDNIDSNENHIGLLNNDEYLYGYSYDKDNCVFNVKVKVPYYAEVEYDNVEVLDYDDSYVDFKITGSNLSEAYFAYVYKSIEGYEDPGICLTMAITENVADSLGFGDDIRKYIADKEKPQVTVIHEGTSEKLRVRLCQMLSAGAPLIYDEGDYYLYLFPMYSYPYGDTKVVSSVSMSDPIIIPFTLGPKQVKHTTKKYKATSITNTSSDTKKENSNPDYAAKKEVISGSGKKGSTRTITPIEGRKVSDVIVLDKNDNEVEVTKNDDGTYSFTQPASNVDVKVIYKDKEIVLDLKSPNATVYGEDYKLDATPIAVSDRTCVPARFIAENLDCNVIWDDKNPDKVIINGEDKKMEITLGSDIVLVNEKEVTLDVKAFASNDRTYLPLRFISEELGLVVDWNENKPDEVKMVKKYD